MRPAPVVRESVLQAYPQIADWLQPVFASLDEKTLQQLNARIAVEGWMRKKSPQITSDKKGG
ncbi:Osmoprotectant ABC transporter binding proteinYehZ [Salmonella enterica subsp. arizonae]|uniref:Osmoprotectant ABC transporter binding proteinYehZ n=1 Tax=Salmonella enterica subsp. arizonae TaxID=59203 RepID=A0A379SUQ9_SALER|nr:Osmoprotectant ABC transporter binding proteinYehZ [Salmonella enterica subsp. arizonae]